MWGPTTPVQRAEAWALAALALVTATPLTWLELGQALPVWVVGFAMLAMLCVFAWRSERWPATALGALRLALWAVLAAATVMALGAAVVVWREPELSWLRAALGAGPVLALALALCPGLVLIALGGALRNHLMPARPTGLDAVAESGRP